MATALIVNNRYYSFTLTGAVRRMTELSEEINNHKDINRDDLSYLTCELYDLNDYIDNYAERYSYYVTRHQLIKICKYRVILNKLKQQLQCFEFTSTEFSFSSYFDNKKIRDTIIGKMQYYLNEYIEYLNTIGFELHDPTQDKMLYELLNY